MSQTTATTQIAPQTRGRKPPGPRGALFTGVLADFRRDPLAFLTQAARQYGDVVRLDFGIADSYFLNHPNHLKRVLQENNRNYKRNDFLINLLKISSGDNIFTSNGEFWLRQRRLMQPAFHRQRIMRFGQIMTDATERMLAQWDRHDARQPLQIEDEMTRLTLGVVGLALFSVDLSEEASIFGPAFGTSVEYLNYRLNHLLYAPLWLPTRRNRAYKQAVQTVNAHIDALIRARRADNTDKGDLLSMLMLARDDETGAMMSDEQVRNEAATMIFAGHETTANTLTWALYLLSQNPDAEQKLHAELRDVLGGRTPTSEDLPSLSYTRMVIDETLRLYPPAWGISRQAIGADEIDGYAIPPKVGIFLAPYVTQRYPRWWEHPEQFDPERFTPERSANRPHHAYIPFGAGPRMCIGNVFALTEATLVLATIAQRYRLRLVTGHRVEAWPIFTLRTRYGLPMHISRR